MITKTKAPDLILPAFSVTTGRRNKQTTHYPAWNISAYARQAHRPAPVAEEKEKTPTAPAKVAAIKPSLFANLARGLRSVFGRRGA